MDKIDKITVAVPVEEIQVLYNHFKDYINKVPNHNMVIKYSTDEYQRCPADHMIKTFLYYWTDGPQIIIHAVVYDPAYIVINKQQVYIATINHSTPHGSKVITTYDWADPQLIEKLEAQISLLINNR
jgi:hypothetical protein